MFPESEIYVRDHIALDQNEAMKLIKDSEADKIFKFSFWDSKIKSRFKYDTSGRQVCHCAWAPLDWYKPSDKGLLMFGSTKDDFSFVGVLMDTYMDIPGVQKMLQPIFTIKFHNGPGWGCQTPEPVQVVVIFGDHESYVAPLQL